MLRGDLAIDLTLEGPVLTRSTEPGAPGIDSPVARDPAGRPILPYSLVQGRLREVWREMGEVLGVDLGALLGKETGDQDLTPRRGRLYFRDFKAPKAGGSEIVTSVRRNSERRAVDDGALRHLEMPFLPGEEVTFSGWVRYLAVSQAEAVKIAGQIEAGLRFVPSFGSERTSGFGRLIGVSCRLATLPLPAPDLASTEGKERLALVLKFQDPICFPSSLSGGTLFESSDTVPGAAIQGTLARMLAELCGRPAHRPIADLPAPFEALGRAFSLLRFTHAFPVAAPTDSKAPSPARPRSVALSLVKLDPREKEVLDVALCRGPILIDGHAPAFRTDWKNTKVPERIFAGCEPVRELRTRTAIDGDTRRGADEKLFTYEMRRPEGVVWRSEIDLSAVLAEDRTAVEAELRAVLSLGLLGAGKTGADATVSFVKENAAPPDLRPGADDSGAPVWVVVLQTPALLADPERVGEGATDDDLRQAYEAAWRDLSGGALRIVRYFSTERLTGGYIAGRFRGVERGYAPYLLTDQGSTFVLAQENGDPTGLLADWVDHGLPLPNWALERYGDGWSTCPYRREQGYGEIEIATAQAARDRPERSRIEEV